MEDNSFPVTINVYDGYIEMVVSRSRISNEKMQDFNMKDINREIIELDYSNDFISVKFKWKWLQNVYPMIEKFCDQLINNSKTFSNIVKSIDQTNQKLNKSQINTKNIYLNENNQIRVIENNPFILKFIIFE